MDSKPRSPGQLIRTGLTVAALVAVSGCAMHWMPRPATPGQSVAAARHAAVSERSAAETLLTDDVSALRQNWYIFRAQEQDIGRCMRILGFSYPATNAGPEPSIHTVTEDTAGHGAPATYGVLPQGSGAARGPAGSSKPSYADALIGTKFVKSTLPGGTVATYATNGCVSGARRHLFGSVLAFVWDSYIPQDVGLKFDAYLATDRPYMSALSGWQRCMSSAGWEFTSPQSAIASIQNLASGKGITQQKLETRQTSVADADVACDRASHLRLRRHEALAAYVHRLPGQTLAELQNIYLTRQKAARAARHELSS